MRTALAILALALVGCPKPPPDPGPVSGFTDGRDDPPPPPVTEGPEPAPTLTCPGETQCPCVGTADDSGGFAPCPGLECGPTNACTRDCATDAECTSGVSGEACVAGRCAVPCDPTTDDGGCTPSGMVGARCVTLGPGDHFCGY